MRTWRCQAMSSLLYMRSLIWCLVVHSWCLGLNLGFPAGSVGKQSATVQETWIQSLGGEDSLEKGMASYSSILAWRIPGTGEMAYSPWGCKESDTTEQLTFSYTFWLGFGRGQKAQFKGWDEEVSVKGLLSETWIRWKGSSRNKVCLELANPGNTISGWEDGIGEWGEDNVTSHNHIFSHGSWAVCQILCSRKMAITKSW